MMDNETYSQLLDQMIARNRKENRFLEFKSNYQDARHLESIFRPCPTVPVWTGKTMDTCSLGWMTIP